MYVAYLHAATCAIYIDTLSLKVTFYESVLIFKNINSLCLDLILKIELFVLIVQLVYCTPANSTVIRLILGQTWIIKINAKTAVKTQYSIYHRIYRLN